MLSSSIEPQRLGSAEAVDQTLLAERHRLVLIRFGRQADPTSAAMDMLLHEIAAEVWLTAAIYSVDLDDVREFTDVYELYDPCTVMCFYRNRPVLLDVGFGPDTKVTWPLPDGAVLADAIADAVPEPDLPHGSVVQRWLHAVLQSVVRGLVA